MKEINERAAMALTICFLILGITLLGSACILAGAWVGADKREHEIIREWMSQNEYRLRTGEAKPLPHPYLGSGCAPTYNLQQLDIAKPGGLE